MTEVVSDEPARVRKFADELRELASRAQLPGYSERLLRAAEELERWADELEALRR